MLGFIFGLLLSGLSLILWTLDRTYQHVPARELKRLARRGDEIAALLYRAVAYGMSLRLLLTGGAVLLLVVALACLVSAVGVWLAALVLLVVGAVGGMVMVPSSDLTRSGLWLAKKAAPGLSWTLERAQPVLGFVSRVIRKHRPLHVHTGLYEKSDLVELLERQKDQPDSRILPSEIALLQHAMTFGDHLVADALVPKRVVQMVAASDAVGPVLMDELSKSGHSRFPVYDEKLDNIVGILYLHDLVGMKKTGSVRDVMSRKLNYVHENFTLYQTLQAFLRTKQHLFLAVNSFEELVGIITIEDVIEQMIGRPIVDEFDRYDDLRAVAAADAHKEHKAHKAADEEPKGEPETPMSANETTTTDPTEVVQ